MEAKKAFEQYLINIDKLYRLGNSTEHTFRPDLQNLIKSLFNSEEYSITNEPQHIECGAPDYVILKNSNPVGYIEAKDIVKDIYRLGKIEKAQQERYLKALENLIYTNYIDFILFRHGEQIKKVSIAEIKNGKIDIDKTSIEDAISLFNEFLDYKGASVFTAESLARTMAIKAREFAYVVNEVLKKDIAHNSYIYNQYLAFKENLIENLTPENFANMYAQTLTYGLFVARLNDPTLETFSREEARTLIPATNPFLRGLFDSLAGTNMDKGVEWIVEDLINIFRHIDVASIVSKYGDITASNDPFLHFYETFLSEYDPALRKQAGVYYTPKPVVNYIVKSVDDVLKNNLGISNGLLCDEKKTVKVFNGNTDKKGKKILEDKVFHRLQILDPAVGTGTFLAEIVRYIHESFGGQKGLWKGYVEDSLLPRLNGFEIMMVPYAIAHIKIGMLLKETGYTPKDNNRLNIYLTDSLEKGKENLHTLWAMFLSNETRQVSKIKNENPVMIILGNPPYKRDSVNNGAWISGLMSDYLKEPNSKEKLNEQNPKNINDDYIKFIRYSQYLVDHNEEGVLAFINPNGYLEATTFRGVRWTLLNAFDDIYILNLHGNTRKGELLEEGEIDENVFDIQTGVCINIFIRNKNHKGLAKVHYKDIYGSRTFKYDWLLNHRFIDTDWVEIEPTAPHYLLTPLETKGINTYYSGIKVSELFTVNCTGFATHRDHFAVAFNKDEIKDRIRNLLTEEYTDDELKDKYLLKDNRDWQLNKSRKLLKNIENIDEFITECLYRPFDIRYCFLNKVAMDYPRNEIVNNVINRQNICLLLPRQQSREGFKHAWITDIPAEACVVSTRTSEQNYVFPLKLYYKDLLNDSKYNIDEKQCKKLFENIDISVSETKSANTCLPEDLMYYIYAVLNSNIYSEKYSQFTKSDFPYIPKPNSKEGFFRLAEMGKKLANIHMMKNNIGLCELKTSFNIEGSDNVEQIKFIENKIFINKTQYFDNVPENVFNFIIGGHKPAELWLKTRKGKNLTYNEITHYQKMLLSIDQTFEIIKNIDEIYKTEFNL